MDKITYHTTKVVEVKKTTACWGCLKSTPAKTKLHLHTTGTYDAAAHHHYCPSCHDFLERYAQRKPTDEPSHYHWPQGGIINAIHALELEDL